MISSISNENNFVLVEYPSLKFFFLNITFHYSRERIAKLQNEKSGFVEKLLNGYPLSREKLVKGKLDLPWQSRASNSNY